MGLDSNTGCPKHSAWFPNFLITGRSKVDTAEAYVLQIDLPNQRLSFKPCLSDYFYKAMLWNGGETMTPKDPFHPFSENEGMA